MHFKNTLSKLVLCTTLVPLFSESLIANSVNLNPISSTVSQINTRAKEDQIDYTQFITSDK